MGRRNVSNTTAQVLSSVRAAFTLDITPELTLRHPQRHSAHLFVQTADIESTSPEPKTYTQKADSGNEMTRAWCDGCGAGVWLRSASKPGLTFLKAGESLRCWLVPCQTMGKDLG